MMMGGYTEFSNTLLNNCQGLYIVKGPIQGPAPSHDLNQEKKHLIKKGFEDDEALKKDSF